MYGWIWRRNMFNTEFNSLYVAVQDFILDENSSPTFGDPEAQIKYYRGIVDEYNTLIFNLENIKKQITVSSQLYLEISHLIEKLNSAFEKYKTKSAVVRAYLNEMKVLNKKVTFAEKLYRFELLFTTKPLVKISVEEIQTILTYARNYVNDSSNFYYYASNPFVINPSLGISIPVKYSFDTGEKMLTSLYNYMYGLYNEHLNTNKAELDNLVSLGKSIEEKIYEFKDVVSKAKKNKIQIDETATPQSFYNLVTEVEKAFEVYYSSIVNLGVYRFTDLSHLFTDVYNDAKLFIDEYKANQLYVVYDNELIYDTKIEKLNERIKLLEDGKIKVDTQYVITDVSLKELVEEIISISRLVKKKIIYTQKYHTSGYSKTLEFEFYQTELFLESIKAYYYQLMSENIYRYSNIGIDNFGDDSISDIRKDFKNKYVNYNIFVSREVEFLNDFEFVEYQKTVNQLQVKLKAAAVVFYDLAIKTSHPTYVPIIEKHYNEFLTKLSKDLVDIKAQRVVDVLKVTDKNKIEAQKKLAYIRDHLTKIDDILKLSNKYVFFGLTDYIRLTIYTPFKALFDNLQNHFNSDDYVQVFNLYDTFYATNLVNFNILYALEKFSVSVNELFSKIDQIDLLYVEEYSTNKVSNKYAEAIDMLNDLFDDETYKVTRNELFTELDILYEFVISTRPNENAFLINEKNLKKLYFDNQFMKINYIRWYHNILKTYDRYVLLDKNKLLHSDLYLPRKNIIEQFSQQNKLNTMIVTQNKTLSSLTKMIQEYTADTNYKTVNLSTELIKNIDVYNVGIVPSFGKYCNAVSELEKIVEVVDIDLEKKKLEEAHKKQWVEMIRDNDIDEPEKVSYNEMDVMTGTVPYTVELKAKMESNVDPSGAEIAATYEWYIGGVTKKGNEISHTFYDEGKHSVRCDILYPNGETLSRFIEFDLAGPTNSQIVKMDNTVYSPTNTNINTPKLTYLDPESKTLITLPINITGSITDALDAGSISFSPNGVITTDKAGLVILGFEGTQFAGNKFDTSKIFTEKFEYPPEDSAEFLFDFKVAAPISGLTTVDITNSKFIKFMAKVPNDVENVYAIKKASSYQDAGKSLKLFTGDRVVFRNGFGRYAVVEITDMQLKSEAENVFDYSIKFKFFVNTSLNQFDRDVFSPTETNMTVPTLVFKTSVRELFNNLVVRLEEINALRDKLIGDIDSETYETIVSQISELESQNKSFYLFEELDKIKAKRYSLEQLYMDLNSSINVDYSQPTESLNSMIEKYRDHVLNAKSFEAYSTSINAYEFRKNIVDLGVLIDLYKDQQTALEIIIETYNYKIKDVGYYSNRVKDIKMFETSDFVNKNLSYGGMLVSLVKKLRNLLFRIKLVINFPIMSEGQHIVMSNLFYRLKQDAITGEWIKQSELDFFLLHKKLELKHGYELNKVEEGYPYKEFITEIVDIEKELFGKGLSTTDVKNISNYIQTVETKAVSEYDDFFMIPFWLDYLEKNV